MPGDLMPSLTIVKRFTYRGDSTEEFLNTYHFDAGSPANTTRWKALADAAILLEKAMYGSDVSIVRAFGHDAGSVVAAWSYDYLGAGAAVAGTFTPPSFGEMPGDIAAWIRYGTTQFTSRGKPIYLRNYYHGVYQAGLTGANHDKLSAGQVTAFQAYGNAWVAGFSDGTATHRRAGPRGAIAQNALAATYLTTRTLKKRGRRSAP
jgi:hypothetical protein